MASGGLRMSGAALGLGMAALAGAAAAHPTGEIVAFGRTAGECAAATPPGTGGTGLAPARPMSRTRFLDRSDRIEARLCGSFGMRLRVVPGPGEAEPRTVDVRVLHPRFAGPNGATSTEDDFPSAIVFGQTHAGFTFDHAWELAPGPWTIAVYAGGVLLAAQRFQVTLPAAGARTSDCGGETS